MIKKVPHRDRIVVLYAALVFLPASKKPFVDFQHALNLIFEQPVGVVIFDGSFQDGQQRGVVFFGLPDRPAGEKSQPYAFTVRPDTG